MQTLYGIDCAREFIDSNNNVEMMNVYFAYDALFACDAYKALDAVVLTSNFRLHKDCNGDIVLPSGNLFPGEGIVDIYINTFGERQAEFLSSPLVKYALLQIRHHAEDPSSPMALWSICDPEQEDKEKKAVCAKDQYLARSKQGIISDAVVNYLERKTGKRLGDSKGPIYQNYRMA